VHVCVCVLTDTLLYLRSVCVCVLFLGVCVEHSPFLSNHWVRVWGVTGQWHQGQKRACTW
jgi:hypothetical protein